MFIAVINVANRSVFRKPIHEQFHVIFLYISEYLMSISPEDCIYPSCLNRASVNTYPVCYQHLDYFSQQRSEHQLLQQPATAAGNEGMQ